MEKVILMLSPESSEYTANKYTKQKFFYLINFFHSIRISSIPFYIQWVLNVKEKEQGAGNTAFLIKKGNLVLIGFLYSDEPDGGPFFEISTGQFVKLLTEWEKFVKAKTQKITITEQNGIITIEGE